MTDAQMGLAVATPAIIVMALLMSTLTLTLYIMFRHWHDDGYARTIAFCALVTVQWASAFERWRAFLTLSQIAETRKYAAPRPA